MKGPTLGFWWLGLLGIVASGGCRPEPPPNPNDPRQVGLVRASVLKRNLQAAYEALRLRERRGEISSEELRRSLREFAAESLAHVDLSRIPEKEAWEYGDVFRTAEKWEEARRLYEVAVRVADNEDRRVNDHLRLAHALAALGKVEEAIATARKVFDAPPNEKAPILPAVLFEISEQGAGRGHDLELARLVEEAIDQHEQALVDPATPAGRDFLIARPFLIAQAWDRIVSLLGRAGARDELARALQRRDRSLSRHGRV